MASSGNKNGTGKGKSARRDTSAGGKPKPVDPRAATTSSAKPVKAASAARAAAPKNKPAAKARAASAPASKPKTSPGTVSAAKPKTSPGTVAAVKAKTSPGTVEAPKAKTSPGTVAAAKPKTSPGTVAAAKPKTSPGTVAAVKAKTSPGTVEAAKPKTSPGTVAAAKAKTDSVPGTVAAPKTKAKSSPGTVAAPRTDNQPDLFPAAELAPRAPAPLVEADEVADLTPTPEPARAQAPKPSYEAPQGSAYRHETVDTWAAQKLDAAQQSVLDAIRKVVRRVAPRATEAVKWAQPVWEQNGPFAYLKAQKGYVNFGFWRGADLRDPKGLLEGAGERMRHLKIRIGKSVPLTTIANFVREAVQRNEREGDPTKRRV